VVSHSETREWGDDDTLWCCGLSAMVDQFEVEHEGVGSMTPSNDLGDVSSTETLTPLDEVGAVQLSSDITSPSILVKDHVVHGDVHAAVGELPKEVRESVQQVVDSVEEGVGSWKEHRVCDIKVDGVWMRIWSLLCMLCVGLVLYGCVYSAVCGYLGVIGSKPTWRPSIEGPVGKVKGFVANEPYLHQVERLFGDVKVTGCDSGGSGPRFKSSPHHIIKNMCSDGASEHPRGAHFPFMVDCQGCKEHVPLELDFVATHLMRHDTTQFKRVGHHFAQLFQPCATTVSKFEQLDGTWVGRVIQRLLVLLVWYVCVACLGVKPFLMAVWASWFVMPWRHTRFRSCVLLPRCMRGAWQWFVFCWASCTVTLACSGGPFWHHSFHYAARVMRGV